MIEIPKSELNAELLHAIVEEFVMREGTDYGVQEVSLDVKVGQVIRQIDSGAIIIVFDPTTESCTLMEKAEYQQSLIDVKEQSLSQLGDEFYDGLDQDKSNKWND